jgi:hypothetical protein
VGQLGSAGSIGTNTVHVFWPFHCDIAKCSTVVQLYLERVAAGGERPRSGVIGR